jgi:negative regulator of flagellin synthesis FlgM
MEIEKNQGVQLDAYVNQVHDKNKAESSEEKSNKVAAKTDTVVISDAAKRIQEVRSQLDAVPDVNETKVAQLRKEIEEGTYQRSADDIAAKMIREGLINDGVN